MRVPRRLPLVIATCVLTVITACYRESPVPATVPTAVFVTPEPTIWASRQGAPAEQGQPEVVDAAPNPAASPSPAYAGVGAGIPTPDPTPAGHDPSAGMELYTVGRGQTLGWIALRYECSVDEIVALNGLADANSVYAGQKLLIPVSPSRTSASLKLIPDSEMVYGPAYIHFDLAGFVAEQGGYLSSYWENVEGRSITGAEIVQLVSQRTSVGPRVLLALLELRSGWVTRPTVAAETLDHPMGNYEGYGGLYRQLEWAAVRLNEGYYG